MNDNVLPKIWRQNPYKPSKSGNGITVKDLPKQPKPRRKPNKQ